MELGDSLMSGPSHRVCFPCAHQGAESFIDVGCHPSLRCAEVVVLGEAMGDYFAHYGGDYVI